MSYTFMIKLLCLGVLITGVMGASASSAHALAEWMVEGANLGAAEPEVEMSTEKDVTLLFKINSLELELLCKSSALKALSRIKSTGKFRGKIKLGECQLFVSLLPGQEELACSVRTAGSPVGTVETTELEGQLELHTGGIPILLISPVAGNELAGLIAEGEECILPEQVKLLGRLAIQDAENHAEVEQFTHLIEAFPSLTELYVINETTMEHLVTVHIDLNLLLKNGKRWSGLPG